MKIVFSSQILKYYTLFSFNPKNLIFPKYPVIFTRTFTNSPNNTSLSYKNQLEELIEKSNRLLEITNFTESELLENSDVVVYKRNRICPKCNKEVKISIPEQVENVCADAWRYFHKFSYAPNCPIYGIMKFVKYSKLRTEQKALLHN
uniref:Uncharacterized protein n=1 Tax=Theileria annulata TaxID=5874 RepID=A0A3B0MP21_THEAN